MRNKMTEATDSIASDKGPEMGATHDIRSQAVSVMTEGQFPAMLHFFRTFQGEVPGTDELVISIRNAADPKSADHQWVRLTELMLQAGNAVVNGQQEELATLRSKNEHLAREAAALTTKLSAATTAGNGDQVAAAAAAAGRIADLETANIELKAERNILQRLIADGKLGHSSNTNRSNLPHPPQFSASETDAAKRAAEFNSWRSAIRSRWITFAHEFPTEVSKILYVAALLKGTAAVPAQAGIDTITRNPNNPTVWEWQTAEDFFEFLQEKHANLDLVADAEKKLASDKMYQKGELAAFSDFLTEFTTLCDQANWDGATRVRAFRERLSGPLRALIRGVVDQPARHDWRAWVQLAQKLASNLETEEQFRKGSSYNHRGNGGDNKSKDPDAMDLDKLSVNRLSQEERNRRMSYGQCFECGQAGHIARDCRSAKNRNGNRGGAAGGSGRQGGQRGGNQNNGRGGNSNDNTGSYANYGNWGGNAGSTGGYQGGFGGFNQQNPKFSANYNSGFGGGRQQYPAPPGVGRATNGQRARFMDVDRPGYIVGEVGPDDSEYGDHDQRGFNRGQNIFDYSNEYDARRGQQGNA
jgi:hypothetical protein